MKKWRYIALISLLSAISATCQNTNSETQNRCDEGAIALFDGQTLKGWRITEFGPQGPVYVKEGNMVLGSGDGCTGVTIEQEFPKMNYEVTLEAKRVSGTDFFCGISFPFNDEFATLVVGGWGGTVVGLSCIDGYDASDNETGRLKKFIKDRWYHIRLKVTEEGIKVWIDEMLTIDHLKDERPLSVRSEVLPSLPFGICSWQTTSALRNICLKKIE